MMNLPETEEYEEGIYQIETTDRVIGGVNGTSNLQAKQLANRTKYLKAKTDALEEDLSELDESTVKNEEKGVANGIATLDENARIPYSQLPESTIEYKGIWNAETNTPTLADGTGTKGSMYIVSVGGTQDLGSGEITFLENDRVIYNGSIWQKLSSGGVNSVNSKTPTDGNVTLTGTDISISENDDTKINVALSQKATSVNGKQSSNGNVTLYGTDIQVSNNDSTSVATSLSQKATSNEIANFKAVELSSSTPFIDFHSNQSPEDWTSRIIDNGNNLEIDAKNKPILVKHSGTQFWLKSYNSLEGKKIIFLGDSITWGANGQDNLNQVAVPYPQYIANKFGCTCINEGIKGDTIAWNSLTGGMVGRITTFDFTGVDYLVLFGGTNDQQQGLPLEVSEVGDINHSTMGAILNIKNFIRQQHPTVKLIICTPMHKATPYELLNYGLSTLVTRIKQDCANYCVPMIDLFTKKSELDFRDSNIRSVYASDDVHPNQLGYNELGDYIGMKLAFSNFD